MTKSLPWLALLFIFTCGIPLHATLRETEVQVEIRYGKHLDSEPGAYGADIYKTYKCNGLNITVLFCGGKSHGERYANIDKRKLSEPEIADLLAQNASGGTWVPVNQLSLGPDRKEWTLTKEDGEISKGYLTPSGELLVIANQPVGDSYRVESRSTLEELIKADLIVCVVAEDLKVSTGSVTAIGPVAIPVTAKNPIAIRGQPGNPLRFEADALFLPKARYYLIFLNWDKKGPHQLTGTIIGFDQPLPNFESKFDKAADAYQLVKDMFLAERSVGCSLGEAVLLADAPPPLLKSLSPRIIAYSKVGDNPLRVIAAAYLLLKADGFPAFKEINIPDFERVLLPKDGGAAPFGADTFTAYCISWKIVEWMKDHSSEENYLKLAQFAESQSGEGRSAVLMAMRPYASMFNYRSIVAMLADSNSNVRYAVMSNLQMAFGESHPSTDIVRRHSEAMIGYWQRRISQDTAR